MPECVVIDGEAQNHTCTELCPDDTVTCALVRCVLSCSHSIAHVFLISVKTCSFPFMQRSARKQSAQQHARSRREVCVLVLPFVPHLSSFVYVLCLAGHRSIMNSHFLTVHFHFSFVSYACVCVGVMLVATAHGNELDNVIKVRASLCVSVQEESASAQLRLSCALSCLQRVYVHGSQINWCSLATAVQNPALADLVGSIESIPVYNTCAIKPYVICLQPTINVFTARRTGPLQTS